MPVGVGLSKTMTLDAFQEAFQQTQGDNHILRLPCFVEGNVATQIPI